MKLSELIRKRRILLAAIALIPCMVFTVMIFFYRDDYFVSPRQPGYGKSIKLGDRHQKVLLPAGFHFPEGTLQEHLKGTSSEDWETLQLDDNEVMKLPPLEPGRFKNKKSSLHGISEEKKCTNKLQLVFGTDESKQLPLNLKKVFEIFKEEAQTYQDTYNQHLLPIFEEYMNVKKHHMHWFRFSGSSVWLKDYNVHFVVSRLVFSEMAERNNPRVSLLLAQVFDEYWQEVEDVRLVHPTNYLENSDSFKIKDQEFRLERFPRILPAPFYLSESDLYWGAEDPRMMLVRNKNGHEEPVVVFNACQGQEVVEDDEEEEDVVVEMGRAMYMSFPFQIQRGKGVSALGHDPTAEDIFLRTNQLTIEGDLQKEVEKNWTPFISSAGAYDENIFFATHLSPLRVIKCKLWTDGKPCSVEENQGGKVGPLRGGTPLISLKRIPKDDQEFFFGFARMHLKDCGCGLHFYRPNLVVLARKGSKWSITHVSSSIDLGMEVIPWLDDGKVCADINAMLPNGIESLDRDRDLLSLEVSVSDATVERVTIHGLLRELEKTKYWEDKPGNLKTPVKCAIDASIEFCKIYGTHHHKKRWFNPVFESTSLDY